MNLFKFFRNQRGFTLLEIAVVLVVITILAGAAMPTVAKKVRIAYAQKTAQEIGIIQDASKNYYIDNKGWPASISTLQTAGYLSSVWSGNNPWGNAYAVSEGATPQTFKVSTTMPSELTGAATALLPSSSAVGGVVTSEIPVPGEEPSLESLVHRYSDDETLRTMTQRLITPAIVGETGSSAWGLNLSDTADPDSGLAAGEGRIGSFAVGTTDNSLAKLTVSGTADQIQQIVRAYSAQTANLAEWQNSAGTVLASIDPSGNPTIQNTAPQLVLKDTTTGAKYLLAKVDGNKAYLQEIGGTDGSLITLDLANNRLGLSANSHINFGSTDGDSGYGIKDDSGTIKLKHSGGNWRAPAIISGTQNYLTKFATSDTLGNSGIYDNGTSIGIATTNPDPNAKLDVEGPVQFGTGSTTATIKGIYDSAVAEGSWRYITTNGTYTFNHNLGVFPKFVIVYVAQNSNGSGWCLQGSIYGGLGYDEQTGVVEITSTALTVRTGSSVIAGFQNRNGTRTTPNSGYCRVVALG